MRAYFDQQLELLKDEMVYMGGLCEEAIQLTVEALLNGDIKRAKTINNMMSQISQQERSIENVCLKLLMQQQPVARDLRTISAALKMVTDMERIGIQACEIAEIISVGNIEHAADRVDFQQISDAVSNMVHMSLQAFGDKDMELANEVLKYDDVVDNLFCDIRGDLIGKLKAGSTDAEYLMDMMMIDKYFERIGDHAVNIAKWVNFSITGEIEIIE
ncbi:phosphate signaling complex protein PhoU [Anaerovibrio sp.]|uniref:phosphate signaling complex protein PhoU n=1 Tax=Anaerovibrio sp. TaxID=1872532 RepID=UPI003F139175